MGQECESDQRSPCGTSPFIPLLPLHTHKHYNDTRCHRDAFPSAGTTEVRLRILYSPAAVSGDKSEESGLAIDRELHSSPSGGGETDQTDGYERVDSGCLKDANGELVACGGNWDRWSDMQEEMAGGGWLSSACCRSKM